MSRLRAMIRQARAAVPHALLPAERLLASERVAAALEARRISAPIHADTGPHPDPAALRDGDLARLVDRGWSPAGTVRLAMSATEAALARRRRSLDRAIVHAYLRHYPRTNPAFEVLRLAAEAAAGRHDWAWADRAVLWANDGSIAAAALIATPAGRVALGLQGALGDGRLVRALSDPPFAS